MKSEYLTAKTILSSIIVIGCLFLGLLWQQGREEATCKTCESKLYGIGYALEYFKTKKGGISQANLENKNAIAVSWRVLILPAWNKDDFFNQYRLNESWNSLHNRELTRHRYGEAYFCPNDSIANSEGKASYLAVVGPKTLWNVMNKGNIQVSQKELSSKILIIEVPNSGIYWTEPQDISVKDAIALFRSEKNNRHPKGLHYLTGDCRVHSFDEIHNIEDFICMLTYDP